MNTRRGSRWNSLWLTGALVIGVVGGWWFAARETSPDATRHPDVASVPVLQRHNDTYGAAPAVVTRTVSDPVAAYLALRDEADPKSRLELIDAYARQIRPGDPLDLFTQAMVDPDDAVRDRARLHFDRAMAASVSSATPVALAARPREGQSADRSGATH